MTFDAVSLVTKVAALDRRLARLAEAGVVPPRPSLQGFEGAVVASALAVAPHDWVFWGPALCAPALTRGLTSTDLFAHALDGLEAAALAERRLVTCTLGPATRVPQAAGLAWAGRRDHVVALVDLGEDALSDGDVHVGLNLGAVLDAALVVVVRSTGRRPVAERAEGYGIRSVVASAALDEALPAVSDAVEQARRDRVPQLVELRAVAPIAPSRVTAYDDVLEAALREAERRVHARSPSPSSAVP